MVKERRVIHYMIETLYFELFFSCSNSLSHYNLYSYCSNLISFLVLLTAELNASAPLNFKTLEYPMCNRAQM